MRSTIMFALAFSLVVAGCDRNTEPKNNIGGGPSDQTDNTVNKSDNKNDANKLKKTDNGEVMVGKDGGGAESLAGGGDKTTNGATGKSMDEAANKDAGK